MKTDQELKQLAIDIVDNKVFTDRHLRDGESTNVYMVFMPIALGAFKDMTDEQKKGIGLLYEYYDKAGPRSFNGYPIFMSVQILSVDEYQIMVKHFEEYSAIKESFVHKP
jgi:hypothetical protein